MRKKLLLAIAFAIGIWAYVLILASNPRNSARAGGANLGPEDGIIALFSPSGGCTDALLGEINKASQTIDMQAFSFTSPEIAQALASASARGVHVRLILDKKRLIDRDSKAGFFRSHGVPVFVDDHHGLAHNKVVVIDGKVLITGSFNFTHEAEEQNAENLLIIHDRPKLIALYAANFEQHFNHSIPLTAVPGKP